MAIALAYDFMTPVPPVADNPQSVHRIRVLFCPVPTNSDGPRTMAPLNGNRDTRAVPAAGITDVPSSAAPGSGLMIYSHRL